MMNFEKMGMRLLLGSALWLLANTALAQLIDDIEITPREDAAEVRIKLTMPVRYVRHFPVEKGELVNIYFQITSVDSLSDTLREEHRKSPKTTLVPPFTVTFTSFGATDIVRDPLYLAIQFSKPVKFKVREGGDNRSFILTIPTAPAADDKPAPAGESSGSKTTN